MFKLSPVVGGDSTEISSPGKIFDQPPWEMSSIWTKFADHVGDHVVQSPEASVLVKTPGTESSNPPPPPQSLNDSTFGLMFY